MNPTHPSPTAGIVFASTGPTYARLTAIALRQLRTVEPDVAVSLFCDSQTAAVLADDAAALNITLHELADPQLNWNDKLAAFEQAPYDRTIYLDTDVLAIRPFAAELFAALDYTPLLARSAGIGFNLPWETERYPAALPQYNTGVIAFDRAKTAAVWPRWRALREQYPESHDQPTFRAAVLDSGLTASELPPSYNLLDGDTVTLPVRLIHCVSCKPAMLSDRARARLIRWAGGLELPAMTYLRFTLMRRGKPTWLLPLHIASRRWSRLKRKLTRKGRR